MTNSTIYAKRIRSIRDRKWSVKLISGPRRNAVIRFDTEEEARIEAYYQDDVHGVCTIIRAPRYVKE